MFPSHEAAIFTAVCLVQVVAVAGVVLARLTLGAGEQRWCQVLYFTALLSIGGLTMATVFAGSGHWFTFGATLALMAVGGTIDFGQTKRTAI